MRWKLRIGDVVRNPARPFAALDQRRRVNLNNALATQLVPDKSDAAILAWFSPIPWRSPGLVQFRDKKTAAPMNQNYTLASRPADQPEGWACDREFSQTQRNQNESI